MVNMATSHIIEPSLIIIEEKQIGGRVGSPPEIIRRYKEELIAAHGMVEAYLNAKRPISLVTATYDIIDSSQALAAVEDYPINSLITVLDGSNNEPITTDNDDKHIWPSTQWPTTVVAQYRGGIEPPVYDAIVRQAEVLSSRDNDAPENINFLGLPDFDPKKDPRYRTGLSTDVRQMLSPFRVIGF